MERKDESERRSVAGNSLTNHDQGSQETKTENPVLPSSPGDVEEAVKLRASQQGPSTFALRPSSDFSIARPPQSTNRTSASEKSPNRSPPKYTIDTVGGTRLCKSKRKTSPWLPVILNQKNAPDMQQSSRIVIPKGASSVVRIFGRDLNLSEQVLTGSKNLSGNWSPDLKALAKEWVEDNPFWKQERHRNCENVRFRPHPTTIQIQESGDIHCYAEDTPSQSTTQIKSNPIQVKNTQESEELKLDTSVIKVGNAKEKETVVAIQGDRDFNKEVQELTHKTDKGSTEFGAVDLNDSSKAEGLKEKAVNEDRPEGADSLQGLILRGKKARRIARKRLAEEDKFYQTQLLRKKIFVPFKEVEAMQE